MHRIGPLSLLFVTAAASLHAQATWEITPTAGYRYGGTVNGETGKFIANDGFAWGATIGYRVKPDGLVEFVYSRQSTNILFDSDTAAERTIGNAAVEYFQLGGALEFGHDEKTKPFFALTVGATHLSPESPDFGDDWLFSFGGALGVKTYLSRNVGLRAQARLWMSTLSSDTDFWCTLPGGCVIVASNSTFFTQGEFSGGVMFVF
ncbi:MAG TPA: hypothetical protein PLI70_03450 [Gemmatimonadales bacterium]|nr:hypothetical protein [Gemmatimonadales bacterium]HRZ10035.1 hypothetical protein [Gemmatimonadales bacterium]